MRQSIILTLLLSSGFIQLSEAQQMTLEKLKSHLAKEAKEIQSEGNMVEYELDSVRIYLISDVSSDRMRLMAGVVEEKDLTTSDFKLLLEANYDRALDAKYALSDGVLWSVFVHPLSDLTPTVLKSGLYQVRNLVYTYGSTYTSTQFVYAGAADDDKDRKN